MPCTVLHEARVTASPLIRATLSTRFMGYVLKAVITGGPERRRILAAMALAVMGGLGGGTLGLIGTTFQDNVVSLGVLGALASLAGFLSPVLLALDDPPGPDATMKT